jgi:DUF2934 family protein
MLCECVACEISEKTVMAKRSNSRSQAGDSAAPPAQPRARRARDPNSTAAGAVGTRGHEPIDAGAIGSGPSELAPSEEDIRIRAYHRYLERGGGHGMDFQDWLEAERELKRSR